MAGITFTALVGCTVPIQQAVMGGISGRQLAVGVAQAGGLGMMHSFGPLPLEKRIQWVRANTSGAWGIGFRADKIDENREAFEYAIEQAPIIELCWADPDRELVQQIHRRQVLAFWQVGDTQSAIAAADCGVDAIILQGSEAGGHLCGDTPLMALLDSVVGRVDVPLIAAGGISSGRSMAAVFQAGASAVRIGTLFASCIESDASDPYRNALVNAKSKDSVCTTLFGAEWPDAPHRVLGKCIDAAKLDNTDPIGMYDDGSSRFEIPRFSTLAPTRYSSGPHEAMAMYAGTGVGDIRDIESAETVVHRLSVHAREPYAE